MKNFKLFLPAFFLFFLGIQNTLIAQQGTSCNSSFIAIPHDTCAATDYPLSSGGVTWIQFTATAPSIAIFVSVPSEPLDTPMAHINKISLFDGICGNLQTLAEESISHHPDSLPILRANNLIVGNIYFIGISGFIPSPTCRVCSKVITYFGLCIINTNNTTVQSQSCPACGVNLVVNGDFETPPIPNQVQYALYSPSSGNMNFVTAFNGNTNQYCVSNYNVNPHNDPAERADHTSGTGYFLWGDAPSNVCCNNLKKIVWKQDVSVQYGQAYVFGMWIKDVGSHYDIHWTKFKFKVNGNFISNNWFDNASSHTWNYFCQQWQSDVNGTVTLEIVCKGNADFSGNDFGIDDIQFRNTVFSGIPTISASPSTTISQGDQVILTASGGDVYFWSTGETTQTITVAPCVTTTYTVVASSNVSGCEGQAATITINVLTPSTSFSYAPPCAGNLILFSNTSTGYNQSSVYFWNFGDNTTSTATNPSHTYGAPGTYTITLTGTNACGSNTISIPINIIPATSTYNVNCCSSDPLINTYNFDEVNGPFVVTNPYTLSNPLIWAGQQYKIRGTITIMPGAKLIINSGSIIQFDPNSKIVVSPGAILEVINSTLTGLQTCGTMWQGIEVWGNKTKTQIDIQIPATGQLWQGKVILNNSTVALAHNGVVLGRRQGSLFNTNFGGGILLVTNSSFTNCGYGVRFIPYPFVNNSRIIDCAFSSTTLPDPGYSSSNSYTYPNPANPVYSYANQLQRTYAFAISIGVKFVFFDDNFFNNAEYGVIGVNSSLLLTDVNSSSLSNTFTNIKAGCLHANTSSSPFYANKVKFNTYSTTLIPIQTWAGIGDNVTNNFIPLGALVGIGNVSSQAITINDNTIGGSTTGCLIGISTSNTGAMGGLIGRNNTTTGNQFTKCVNGTWMAGNNSFLQITCNTYVNPTTANYITNWNNFGPLANQGNLPIINDQDPAGNTFAQFSPLRNQINSITLFDYYAHSADISGNPVTVIPTPTGSLTASNIINTGIQQTNTSCDPGPPCSNCSGRLSQLDGTILQLEAEKTNIENQLDGGQTQQLLDAINSTMPSGQLENLLLTHSPLSDLVLFAYIAKSGTPPEIFKNVIVPNSPVSKDVRPALDAKIANMAPVIKNQIIAAQSNYSNRTLSVVDRELQNKIGERQQVYNQQMDYFVTASENNPLMKDSVYTLLVRQNTEAAKEAIAASYLADENYIAATQAIANLNPITIEEIAERDLLILLNSIYSNGRDIYAMASSEEQQVRIIAAMQNDCVARANAKVILFAAFGEPLELEFDLNNTQRLASQDTFSIGNNNPFLGESYPNPATDEVNMECNIPENSSGNLRIFDMNGKLVCTKQIASGRQIMAINTKGWQAGIYMCWLDTGETYIGMQKLVILQQE